MSGVMWWADDALTCVDEAFPVSSPWRIVASKSAVLSVLGEPNSEDDPGKTTAAFDVTDGEAWVHLYDYKSDGADVRSWSMRGDLEGAAEPFGAWLEERVGEVYVPKHAAEVQS